MRKWVIFPLVGAFLAVTVQAAEGPVIRLVEFDRVITPATAPRILQAIDDAEQAGDDFVLIELDTPGGLAVSMDKIVKRILSSKVPIVVWVGPSGARAASAGFFILVAADVAAMAPGTRTGAASTIAAFGENSEDNVVLKKINQDYAALIRSIAERRGRDVKACEEAVLSSRSFEESVALEKGLADLLAKDREELLELLEGRTVVRFDGTTVTLRTENASLVVSEFSLRQKFIEFLGTPAVAFLLLMLGLGGLYVEFTQPGVVLPGVVGVLCLLLFFLAAQLLPVSTIAILLVLLGIAMFILEIKVTSYGMLSLGGILCLVIGSLMLVEGPIPELRVPPAVVLPTAIMLSIVLYLVVRLALRAHRTRVATGVEGLPNQVGRVIRDLSPEGKVFIHGEIWNAAAAAGPISRGNRVRVLRVDDMVLTVESAEQPARGED